MSPLSAILPMRRWLALAAAAMLVGCSARNDDGPVIVSVIGNSVELADPAQGTLATPARVMLDSTAQGLVRFDAAGQIEPGLAERWSVIDNGTSYIFRLGEGEWSDGTPVTAADVVTVLRRQIGRGSRNALKPYLSAIDEIVEMTPEVIEVRLKRPRPDLLKLFAQPELAIYRTHAPGGTGPFRWTASGARQVLLRPVFDPARDRDLDIAEPPASATLRLIAERAARGIVRFARGEAQLVTGGTFADWPLVLQTNIAPAERRFDPAAGLFGLAVVDRSGILSDPANRAAIARTIDRAGLVAAIAPEWESVTQLLPEQLDSAAAPATPAWARPATAGEPTAAERIARWKATHPGAASLRIALPIGPGATIIYAYIGAALQSLGIVPVRVAEDAPADLRLIDAVAPYDSGRWYVATACQPCGAAAQTAIEAARDADSPAVRAQQIAIADAALANDVAFIPIARPLRWSLVRLRLNGWCGNARAWHPLNHLRTETE